MDCFARSSIDLLFVDHRNFQCAFVVFVRKAPTRIQYLKASISEEQRRNSVASSKQRLDNRGAVSCLAQWYSLPQNGCLSCSHLGFAQQTGPYRFSRTQSIWRLPVPARHRDLGQQLAAHSHASLGLFTIIHFVVIPRERAGPGR